MAEIPNNLTINLASNMYDIVFLNSLLFFIKKVNFIENINKTQHMAYRWRNCIPNSNDEVPTSYSILNEKKKSSNEFTLHLGYILRDAK